MRNLALALGASAVVVVCVAGACSDTEVVSNGGGTTTSTGTGTGTGTGGNGNTGGTSAGGGCVGGDPCETTCCRIETECDFGFPVTCASIPTTMFNLDCANGGVEAQCNGACLVGATCDDMQATATGNPPDALAACLAECGGGGAGGGGSACVQCAGQGCQTQVGACWQAQACSDYLTCVTGCPVNDSACFAACLTSNPSPESTALADCICGTCSADCPCGAGGAGGTAGAGGTGA
jgi:hypothetical protein